MIGEDPSAAPNGGYSRADGDQCWSRTVTVICADVAPDRRIFAFGGRVDRFGCLRADHPLWRASLRCALHPRVPPRTEQQQAEGFVEGLVPVGEERGEEGPLGGVRTVRSVGACGNASR